MSRIANRFGVPLATLCEANKATIPNCDCACRQVEVKKADGSRAEETLRLTEIRVRKIGDEIRVDVRLTDAIPRESNGKFRAVKSRVGRGVA